MQLEWIIAALRTRCPSFGQRFAGAAQYKQLTEAVALQTPYGFVIPLDDSPEASAASTGVRQSLADSFAVVVVVSNAADEKGQGAVASIHTLRAELWRALLGWRPVAVGGDTADSDYDGITYEGGQVIGIDRARLHYQFEFGARMEIGAEDGYQEIELGLLPDFTGGTLKVDLSEPSDPNTADPESGMDGRFESGAVFPKTGSLAD